jgi:hypothetical protein
MKKLSGLQKEQLSLAGIYLGITVFCLAFCFAAWYWGRQLNYHLSYNDMVTETICETVKHEHLINPKTCGEQ